MPADIDYSRVIALMSAQHLPAYVSYVERGNAWGIGGYDGNGDSKPVYVRTSDGAIVAGPKPMERDEQYRDKRDSNPVSRPAFDPKCYAPVSEARDVWDGRPALRFALRPTCGNDDHDSPFDTLFADATTFAPLAVTGRFSDSGVGVALSQTYAPIGKVILPAKLSVDVGGHGLLFWVREHVRVEYVDYTFYQENPVVRRQSVAASPQP